MAGKKETFRDILRESFPVKLDEFLDASPKIKKAPEKEEKAPLRPQPTISKSDTVAIFDTVSEVDTVAASDTVSGFATVAIFDTVSTSDTVDLLDNYFKMDKDVFDILSQSQSQSEQLVYLYLYRHSYGRHRQTCFTGLKGIMTACNMSKNTVRDALKGLEAKRHIQSVHRLNDKSGKGTIYRVFLPCELPGIESNTHFRVSSKV